MGAPSTSKKTFFTFINKLVVSGIGFINSVLVARFLLSKEDRVVFQFSNTISLVGQTYVGGYTGYYAYSLPRRPNDTEAIVHMGNLYVFTLSILVWILAFLLRNVLFIHLPAAWWWATLCIPFTFIFGYGSRILQGTNQITWLNRANAFQSVFFFLAYVPLMFDRSITEGVRMNATYAIWLTTFGLSACLTTIVAYRLLNRRGIMKWRFSRREWSGTVRYGTWLSISNLVNYCNYRMDFWWIMALVPLNTASEYGIAVTASEVLVNISASVASVVFTRMTGGSRSDAIHITESSARHTFISSTIVAIGMYIFFPWLITTAYGHRYANAIVPFLILLPGLIVKATSNIIIQYATNQIGRPQTAIWLNGFSATVNAVICFLLVPKLGLIGGAIASTVSYALTYGACVLWFARINRVSPLGLIAIRKSDLIPYLQLLSKSWRLVLRRA